MNGWTPDEWEAFCTLIEEAWPGEFDDSARASWRVLLGDLGPHDAIEGLKRLLFEGHTFRPSVSEFLARVRRDPSQPTFDEMFKLVFGRGGVIRTPAPAQIYPDQAALNAAHDKARMAKAKTLHPLVATFVHRQGLRRLAEIRFGDDEWGEKRRSDLERSWNAHVNAFDERMVAALAAGGDIQRGLQRFDPLAELGVSDDRAVLTAGSGSER